MMPGRGEPPHAHVHNRSKIPAKEGLKTEGKDEGWIGDWLNGNEGYTI